ncbi:DUF3224 domain-containing protein [Dyadobacter sp. LHD-138]|uniref:DUF3224 domain-containing protein n=1 Tax=Dyadobacter sp. LHD-138 TaxID=3071413 RepID=UPI0027DFD34E|nr:DUF3224 domain-containing protein [Dyadobacter sp. LHD-138]MDQ6481465.1 DUF3224 domain-containing protein [Dyadobacter sp. LHD-138]
MKLSASAVFHITDGYEESFSKNENGQKLTTGKFFIFYEGELSGESVLMELKNYLNEKKASVYGLERFTGELAGKSGSFVLEHSGIFENGTLTSTKKVVVGSGTNELAGLRGEAVFNSGKTKEFHLKLDYWFIE